MDERDKWVGLEERCDQAITDLIFSRPEEGAPQLGVLLGMLRGEPDLPGAAIKRGQRLVEIGALVGEMTDDQRIELSNELVSFLRFVCHRGRDDD